MKRLALTTIITLSLVLTACSSSSEIKLDNTSKAVVLDHKIQKESIQKEIDLQDLIRRVPKSEIKHKRNER